MYYYVVTQKINIYIKLIWMCFACLQNWILCISEQVINSLIYHWNSWYKHSIARTERCTLNAQNSLQSFEYRKWSLYFFNLYWLFMRHDCFILIHVRVCLFRFSTSYVFSMVPEAKTNKRQWDWIYNLWIRLGRKE